MQIWHKKIQFVLKNLQKIDFSKKNFSVSLRFFFRNANFSKIFINNPQNLYYPLVLNTQNENYMKVWYPQLRPRQHGKPSKSLRAHSTPPTLFRVKLSLVEILRNFYNFEFKMVENTIFDHELSSRSIISICCGWITIKPSWKILLHCPNTHLYSSNILH